jgi:glycyl-tRNA synthetase beta subunit
MKKILYLALSILMLSSTTSLVQAKTSEPRKELTSEQNLRMNQIAQRVEEIKKLDKANLSQTENQELKEELTAMKKEAKKAGQGGIYLSVTALLVIIIVLLILL